MEKTEKINQVACPMHWGVNPINNCIECSHLINISKTHSDVLSVACGVLDTRVVILPIFKA